MNPKNAGAHIIENEFLRIGISSKGAELISLYDLKNSRELLWQGDEAIWPGQAPILFPLVGRLKTKGYVYKGKRYDINIHGFARQMEFTLNEKSKEVVSFTLVSSEETRRQYPFDFEFTVRYSLEERHLLKEHIVTNKSVEDMYYEVGGHDGYQLPLAGGEKMEEYYLSFEGKNALHSYMCNDEVMLLDKKRRIDLDKGRLNLKMSVFSNDALILDSDAGKAVELAGPKTGRLLTVRFPDFEYLGIWTKYMPFDTNYICIEPWSSLPDFLHLGAELTEKIGIRRLSAGQTEVLSYSVDVD